MVYTVLQIKEGEPGTNLRVQWCTFVCICIAGYGNIVFCFPPFQHCRIRRWGVWRKNKCEVPPPAQPWGCVGALQAPPSYIYMHVLNSILVPFPRRIRNRLISTKENDITLNFPVVQMQRGSSDYRSFAAAFATS